MRTTSVVLAVIGSAVVVAGLSFSYGYLLGKGSAYGPLAERGKICEQGLDACEYGLVRCSAHLDQFERWAKNASERARDGKAPAIGPIGVGR